MKTKILLMIAFTLMYFTIHQYKLAHREGRHIPLLTTTESLNGAHDQALVCMELNMGCISPFFIGLIMSLFKWFIPSLFKKPNSSLKRHYVIFYYLKGSRSENMNGTKFISASLSSLSRRIMAKNYFFLCLIFSLRGRRLWQI